MVSFFPGRIRLKTLDKQSTGTLELFFASVLAKQLKRYHSFATWAKQAYAFDEFWKLFDYTMIDTCIYRFRL